MRLTLGEAWVEIDPTGAIISDAQLRLDGKNVRPFFQNPWRDDPRAMDNLTRHLGGEWACVPFGTPHPPADLPTDWRHDQTQASWHRHAHGFGAHSKWTLTQQNANTALAEITYPVTGPIAALTRRVCLASEHEIRLDLLIHARHDARIPVGLHPVFTLADAAPHAAQVIVEGGQTAWTFPRDVEPNESRLKPDQRTVSLSSLTAADGTKIDASRVPFEGQSEDLVLLTEPGGRVSLSRPDLGHRIDVTWDDTDLPSCILWLSNRGRGYAPWDRRVCAIGIEPVAAAFDLGVAASASAHTPLSRGGIKTAVALSKGETWKTSYSISIH